MNQATYDAMQNGAIWRDMNHWGRFRVAGRDAANLLHQLTTSDIKKMRPGQTLETVLLSSKARVLDVLSIRRDADNFLVVTSPNRRELFPSHAQKFVLFRQDVKIEDVSKDGAMFGVFGTRAEELIHQTEAIQTRRLPRGGWILGSQSRDALRQIIAQSGAPMCDDDTFNILRVEAGIPVAGRELTEDVNPWEANLDELISLHKGCYNGQEVVARLHTYQKIKQRLCGLKLEQPLRSEPAKLEHNGREIGFTTSAVVSPQFGPIALAFVRGEAQTPGTKLEVVAHGERQSATVASLPFED